MMTEEQLLCLRRGQMTFDEFWRETRGDWKRLSESLARKWSVPAVEPSDVEQVMLIGCWHALSKWRPRRGVTLKDYAVFQAIDAAKKMLRGQHRKVKRDRIAMEAAERSVPPNQEDQLLREEALRERLSRCELRHARVLNRFARTGCAVRAVAGTTVWPEDLLRLAAQLGKE